MEKKLIGSIILIILLVATISFLGLFDSKKPTITGVVIYEETINTLNWTFDDTNDYSYDNSLISLSNGEAKLVRTIVERTWSVDNFTDAHVISAWEYEPGKDIHDRTSEVQSLDSETVNINPDKEMFDVTFDGELDNNDIISMHIKPDDEDDVEVYLCNNGTSCSQPGYGLIDFDGNEGWYNITITNLDEPKNSFNIKLSEKIKFDYIKAILKDTIIFTSTDISYPESASIETEDIAITGLSSFLNFYENSLLNDQEISYYYSTDSGDNWYGIPNDGDLSSIDTTNKKIRIKAEFSSDGSATPTTYDFSVKYETQICNEDWDTTYGECLSDSTKLKYYTDRNECETANDLPGDNATYISCDYCSPDWSCVSYGECQLNNIKKCIAVEDNNFCYNLTNLNSDSYVGDYNEFSLSCIYNKTGTGFSNLSISVVANEKLIINKTNSTDTILELNASNNLENNFVSIIKYSENKKNTSPSLSALNKYLDIEANNSLKNSINSVKIKIYYTDEEIANVNFNEETLKIYYFNETSSRWQALDSIVNASENYVEVTIAHLSTFGIFGEEIVEEISETSESSSGGGSSGGGGGSTRRISETAAKPVETETVPEKEETVKEKEIEMPEEAKEECDYKIFVSLPEHISFAESDYIKGTVNNIGNCKIENLNTGVSVGLKDIIWIENEKIESIDAGGSVELSLVKKSRTSKTRNLIQGFNIKLPEIGVETYNGSLNFNASVQDQVALEEKVDVKVDLLKPVSTMEIIKLNIPLLFVISLITLGLSYVYYRKRKLKTI
ncbi:MAG: hypothetical protein V1831_03605 [Candidatus Woesearchaeota archaeon]